MITGHVLLDSCLPAGLTVESDPEIGEARRLAEAAAKAQGFEATQGGRVAIVATELATNLVKFARSGRMLIRLVKRDDRAGVEILAIDAGPGMDNAQERQVDGYSTSGTYGSGLGAIGRLSDQFDLYSLPGRGTVALARLWATREAARFDEQFVVGAVCESFPGESASGDGWAVEQEGSRIVTLVTDGLGHGPDAAEASGRAIEVFRRSCHRSAEALIEEIHGALVGTRGAAVAVAEIAAASGQVRFCGIGNISARVLRSPSPINLPSQFGIAGLMRRPIKVVEAPWREGAVLVMHSDGLSERWNLEPYPGLIRHHPALVAATIMRDVRRPLDDATVVALRAVTPADSARRGRQ